MEFYTLFSIIIMLGFVLFVVMRQMGPTANKGIIDSSITLLEERLGGKRSPYHPEPRLYEAFQQDCTDPALLSRLATDILQHCGMEPKDLQVYAEEDLQIENAAGLYSYQNGVSVITIRVSRYARYNMIMAVLIHECMHYFLRHSAIGYSETHDNEILTDTATVYMGFYDYMYHGSVMVGYLRDSEFRYVYNTLREMP